MRYCPSQDWDRYLDQCELPEECICGKANYNDETDAPVYPADEAFCSKACADKYEEQCREEIAAEQHEWFANHCGSCGAAKLVEHLDDSLCLKCRAEYVE